MKGTSATCCSKRLTTTIVTQNLVEGFVPGPDGQVVKQYYKRGDILVFTFQRESGTPDQFGTDRSIISKQLLAS